MKFIENINIDFVSKRKVFFFISILLVIVAITVYIVKGPNYGIDFTGGMLMQVSFDKEIPLEKVRQALEAGSVSSFELQSSQNTVFIKAKETMEAQKLEETIKNSLSKKFTNDKMSVDKVEYVGPSVGSFISQESLKAFVLAFLFMIIYVAFRFKSSTWGVAGVIGIIHDVLITFGFVMLVGKEINVATMAALLTVAGYSINDTIILFDRMRDNIKLSVRDDLKTIINRSINSVLLRTMVTSLTVFAVSIILFFMGGDVLHTFAYIMVIGNVLGTYSSICICANMVYEWDTRKKARKLAK